MGLDRKGDGLGCRKASVRGARVGRLGSSLGCPRAMQLEAILGGDVVVGVLLGGQQLLVESFV